MSIESINPATGEVIEAFEPFTAAQIDATLARAHQTYRHWRTTSFGERSALLRRVAAVLRAQKAELARVATLEMGKPIAESPRPRSRSAPGTATTTPRTPRHSSRDEHVATNAAESYVAFDAARRRAGDHALELPLLAGLPLRRARAHGRQRCRAQARLQCARAARWRSRTSSARPRCPKGVFSTHPGARRARSSRSSPTRASPPSR